MGIKEKARRLVFESCRPKYATVDDVRGLLGKYDLAAGDLARLVSTHFEPISAKKLRGILASGAQDSATLLHRSELDAVVEHLNYINGLTGRKPPA